LSILGTRVLRTEDRRFLTVGGTYTADLDDPRLHGALHATYVRATAAHGRILSIDVDEARGAPGVVAVLTADDVDLAPIPPEGGGYNKAMARPWLARDVVRYVGEPVALVLTEERAQGVDAAELVIVDLDPLPAVTDLRDAERDEVLVHEAAGTNVAARIGGDLDPAFFDGCEVVVTGELDNQKVAPAPLEVRSVACAWHDGRCTLWTSTQNAQGARDSVLGLLGLEPGTVHLITPDVGGGFGAKIGIYPEEVLLAWAARHVGRPVRWVETRTESMNGLGHGRGQRQRFTIGGRRDGTVEAYRLEVLQDVGAYGRLGGNLPGLTMMMAPGVYRIPKVEFASKSLVTHTTPTMAYRGAGRPEATAAVERAMDVFAAELGMDPAEVRRRNLIPADDFPHTTAVGTTYDVGDYERALDLALEAAGYDELRAEQARRRAGGDPMLLGIGVSIYVEVTAGPTAGGEHAEVEVRPDGSVRILTGTSPHGQGHATSFAMLASEELGVPMERIELVWGDTDLVPRGGGTMGSRSLQLGGAAVREAAVVLVERARHVAADLLEANPHDVVLDREQGVFHVTGTPAVAATWADVAAAAAEREPLDGGPGGGGEAGTAGRLAAATEFNADQPTFPFGAHVVVVEVDRETGAVHLRRVLTVDDSGRVLNPVVVEGQRHGGIAQGLAQALWEEVRYDDDGNPLTATFGDYAFPSAAELPSFDLVPMETPTPVNPLGAKGIGESGAIGSTPAAQSAVIDALSHLGVRHVEMPTTSQRVWRAIAAATDGGAEPS
jgi:carbon-monoxide dehydrogenase large subunit